jgi:polyisoprenoid-binding protein YceI
MTDQTAGISALKDGTLTGTWTLDPQATTIALKTKAMWGVVPVKGTFRATGGSAEIGADSVVSAHVEVDAASIATKMKKRDEHLRSADFFDTETYPTITVSIDAVDVSGPTPTASGSLTVRDSTAPIMIPLTVTSVGADEIALDATTVVDRSTVGLAFSKQGATKMENTLTVHARFVRA